MTNKILLASSLVLVACKGGEDKGKEAAQKAAGSPAPGCPLPMPKNVQARFALGAEPEWPAAGCRVDFTSDGKMLGTGVNAPKLIAEGIFTGTCTGQPNISFQSLAPDHAVIEMKGELSAAKPSDTMTVHIVVVDKCNDPLRAGLSPTVLWSLAPGCEKVVTLSHDEAMGPAADYAKLAPVGAGSCEITATMLGLTAKQNVIVK